MSLNAEVNTKSIQKEYQHLKQAKCDRYQARVNIGSKDFPSWGVSPKTTGLSLILLVPPSQSKH